MRICLSLLFLILSFLSYAQKRAEAVVVDFENKEPIEHVSVFNRKDHTITNADGRFLFSSPLDSILFYHTEYEKLATTLNQLSDTLFLKQRVFKLDEVVVTNAKTIYQKIKDSVTSNYMLTPHSETFFIRTVLRRNDTMVRLQDLQGTVRRKTSIYAGNLKLEDDDFKIRINHMRQLGMLKDENGVYFQFPSLYSIYSESVRLNAMGPDFEVVEKPFKNTDDIQVDFSSNPEIDNTSKGHYIINGENNAILSFDAITNIKHEESAKTRKEYSKMLKAQTSVSFIEDKNYGKYYMDFAKRMVSIEIKSKKQQTPTIFEIEIILQTTRSFGNEKVKHNVDEKKDIFKLKFPYNKDYWDNQNQLLLTTEMEEFVTKMGDTNNSFRIRSNLD